MPKAGISYRNSFGFRVQEGEGFRRRTAEIGRGVGPGFEVWGLRFRFWGLGFGVSVLGFEVSGLGFR